MIICDQLSLTNHKESQISLSVFRKIINYNWTIFSDYLWIICQLLIDYCLIFFLLFQFIWSIFFHNLKIILKEFICSLFSKFLLIISHQSGGWGLVKTHRCPQFWWSKKNSNSTQFNVLYFSVSEQIKPLQLIAN